MLHARILRASALRRVVRRGFGRRSVIRRLARRSILAVRAAPVVVQIIVGAVVLVSAWAAVNWIVQVARKPTEVFVAVGSLAKSPEQTWREYGSLFDRHSTAVMTPEL